MVLIYHYQSLSSNHVSCWNGQNWMACIDLTATIQIGVETRWTCNVRQLYSCGHLSMNDTNSKRTWSERLMMGHDSRHSCWHRVNELKSWQKLLTRARAIGELLFKDSLDIDTGIKFSNGCCRCNSARLLYNKVVVVTHIRRPGCILTSRRAHCTTPPFFWKMSKTIGDFCVLY